MKNIVTALMQFVILVIALVIVTFAIPKIAGVARHAKSEKRKNAE